MTVPSCPLPSRQHTIHGYHWSRCLWQKEGGRKQYSEKDEKEMEAELGVFAVDVVRAELVTGGNVTTQMKTREV